MLQNAILAGTGFENRPSVIRRYCHEGMTALLKREPDNPYDSNAIAVFIEVPSLFWFLGHNLNKIGYIKAHTAKTLAKRMDRGISIQAKIIRVYAPPEETYPKVTLELDY